MGTPFLLSFMLAVTMLSLHATAATPLDDYVRKPDPFYKWHALDWKHRGANFTLHAINMTSQMWLTAAETSQPIWRHFLYIAVPDVISRPDAALLYISRGTNEDNYVPDMNDEYISFITSMSASTGTVCAVLRQVPNQPIVFKNDPSHTKLSEDAITAWTWSQFIFKNASAEWLIQLPMAKAAVRAMDTISDFTKQLHSSVRVRKFLVCGQSKRGWTTWTVAAVDKRVVAIAPIVMDLLNVVQNLHHHYRSLGGWTFALADYYGANITRELNNPKTQRMVDIVDPIEAEEEGKQLEEDAETGIEQTETFDTATTSGQLSSSVSLGQRRREAQLEQPGSDSGDCDVGLDQPESTKQRRERERYYVELASDYHDSDSERPKKIKMYKKCLTMPKYIITTGGDEFFLPDDSNFYLSQLRGDTYLRTIPNADHYVTSQQQTIYLGIRAFYLSVLDKVSRPKISWTKTFTETGGTLTLHTDRKPQEVNVYRAQTLDGIRRDFRLVVLDPNNPVSFLPHRVLWYKSTAEAKSENEFSVTFDNPETGWLIFHIQARFAGPDDSNFDFTTENMIIPDRLPFPPCQGEECYGTLV